MPTSTVGKSPTVDFFTGSRDEMRRVRCKRGVEDVTGGDSLFVDTAETEAPAAEGMLLHCKFLGKLMGEMGGFDQVFTFE